MLVETPAVHVTGIGVVTPYGASAAATRAALEHGKIGMRRLRTYLGTDFKPQVAALAADPDFGPQAAPRMVQNARAALADLQTQRRFVTDDRGLSLGILLPEPAPSEGLESDLLLHIAAQIDAEVRDIGLAPETITVFTGGAPALAQALVAFKASLEVGTPLLIIATDSLACRMRLEARARQERLFSARHPYAPIPGEAAVALLLEPESTRQTPTIRAVAVGEDLVTESSQGISTYQIQSDVARAVLSQCAAPLRRIVTDWNNSRFRASEIAHTELRLQDACDTATSVWHVPLQFGDTGAASAPLGLSLSHHVSGDHLFLSAGYTTPFRTALQVFVPSRSAAASDEPVSG